MQNGLATAFHGGAGVYFEEPDVEIIVYHEIVAKDHETVVPVRYIVLCHLHGSFYLDVDLRLNVLFKNVWHSCEAVVSAEVGLHGFLKLFLRPDIVVY